MSQQSKSMVGLRLAYANLMPIWWWMKDVTWPNVKTKHSQWTYEKVIKKTKRN